MGFRIYQPFSSKRRPYIVRQKIINYNPALRRAEEILENPYEKLPNYEDWTLEAQLEAGVPLNGVNPQIIAGNPADLIHAFEMEAVPTQPE